MTKTLEKPQLDNDTINLFDVGCLVNLSIGSWSGRKMLSKADYISMGLDPDKLPSDLANLGRKLLVTKSEIQRFSHLEQRARKYLSRWSVPFSAVGSHFVPIKMLGEVQSSLEEIQKEFFVAVDSFISRFGDIREEVQEKYKDFWDKCLKNCYPSTPEALRRYFRFEWHFYKIAGLNAIQESTITDIQASEEVKKEKVSALRSKMSEEVSSFAKEYVDAMRAETIKFCDLMSARINGKPFGDEEEPKQLTPRSLAMFKNYVDRFKNMNIFGDNEIQKMLEEFRTNFFDLGVTPKDLDNDQMKQSITTSLSKIRNLAKEEGSSILKRKIVI